MDHVAAVLSRTFPDRRVSAVTPARRGNHKQTAFVDFADGYSVVVQLSTDPDELALEMALAEAVRDRTTLPVPRVLATGSIADSGYAVVERANGDELHERFVSLETSVQQEIARTFGRGLAEIHSAFSFECYGDVAVDRRGERFEFRADDSSDWPRWFTAYVRDGIDALPSAFDPVRGSLEDAVEETTVPETADATLYPWDFRPGNALVTDGAVSAVLDWGRPLAAAPGLGVAKVEHLVTDWYAADGASLRRAFRDGYETVSPYPVVEPIYRVSAVVRSAVDSNGEVTRPGYPERTGHRAVSFHRQRLESLL
ncbi:phosphotransferase family protein [Haloferax sp. YSSS75]|uniref:phosphotransferase family protein n=1 Tax=Haloferax sp. YSSS75 TaxID=3388564 RepID=UPI00398CF109